MDTNGMAIPLLCLDMWEHAYYLQFKSDRGTYIQNFWNVVNWSEVLFQQQTMMMSFLCHSSCNFINHIFV